MKKCIWPDNLTHLDHSSIVYKHEPGQIFDGLAVHPMVKLVEGVEGVGEHLGHPVALRDQF